MSCNACKSCVVCQQNKNKMLHKTLIALACLLSGGLYASPYNITSAGTYNLNINATGTSMPGSNGPVPAVLVDARSGGTVTINGTINTDNLGVWIAKTNTASVVINNVAFGEDGSIGTATYGYFIYADHAPNLTVHNCSFTGGNGASHNYGVWGMRLVGDHGVNITGSFQVYNNTFSNCQYSVVFDGIWENGAAYSAQVYENLFVQDASSGSGESDQINMTYSKQVYIWSNLVCGNPDQGTNSNNSGANIQLDTGSDYCYVYSNTVLNGEQDGICAGGTSNTHSLLYSNTINGIMEYDAYGGGGAGLAGAAGSFTYNTVAWWDGNPPFLRCEDQGFSGTATQSNNTFEGKAHVTLSEQQADANSWFSYMSSHSITIGYGTVPSITYPASGDFPP